MVNVGTTTGLSDAYERLACASIVVKREARQRRKVVIDEAFAASIRRNGVLNPIIVRREGLVLVTGERRLTASIQIGLQDIPVRYAEALAQEELEIIELEENLKRSDLAWQDEVRAVARLHELRLAANPDHSQSETGQIVSMDQGQVSRILRVAREIDSNPRLAGAPGISAAYNMVARSDSRKIADAMSDILEGGKGLLRKAFGQAEAQPNIAMPHLNPAEGGGGTGAETQGTQAPNVVSAGSSAGINGTHQRTAGSSQSEAASTPLQPPESILIEDFTLWAPAYEGPRFNFIHCDFPYGIKAFAGPQSGRDKWTTYDDNPEVYWRLIKALCKNLDRLLTPSAHIMFWFSMEHYSETLSAFGQLAPSLEFQPHPLIWLKSDNVGVLPNPEHGPRRIYETCFIATRGERKIVRAVSNGRAAPTDKAHHPSTKPEPVLREFMGMFIDPNSRMLDPTCGSGSSLRAAESLGAANVLGLEINPEHASAARSALRQARAKAALAK